MNTEKSASWSINFMVKNISSEGEKHLFSFSMPNVINPSTMIDLACVYQRKPKYNDAACFHKRIHQKFAVISNLGEVLVQDVGLE